MSLDEIRKKGLITALRVLARGEIGASHLITVAIECRHYTTSPVSIKDIDAFCGFLQDVGANKGVMFSNSDYTDGAKKRAEGAAPRIELQVLTLLEAEDFDWDEFLNDGCQVSECFGTITGPIQREEAKPGIAPLVGHFIFPVALAEQLIRIRRETSKSVRAVR